MSSINFQSAPVSAPTLAAQPAAANMFNMLGLAPAPNPSASTSSFSSLSTLPMQPTTAQSPSAKLANVFSWVDNQNMLKSIDHENCNHSNLENCIPT